MSDELTLLRAQVRMLQQDNQQLRKLANQSKKFFDASQAVMTDHAARLDKFEENLNKVKVDLMQMDQALSIVVTNTTPIKDVP